MVRARFARGRPNIQTAVPTTRPAMRIEAPTRFPAWIAIRANLARIRTAITLRPSAPPPPRQPPPGRSIGNSPEGSSARTAIFLDLYAILAVERKNCGVDRHILV